MPKVTIQCETCGADVELWPSRARGRRYCSQRCASKGSNAQAANSALEPCPSGCGRVLQRGLIARHVASCLTPATLDKLKELAGVIGVDDDTCWEWRHYKSGELVPYPYVSGVPTTNVKGMERASRVAYELFNGVALVGLACHICDNPSCVNPRHIYDGDHSTNGKDAWARGLQMPRGRKS